MRVTLVCWCFCALLTLLFATTFLITYAPGAEGLQLTEQAITGCSAGAAACLAITVGRLPRTHWLHRSKPVWAVLVALAALLTMALVLVG